MLRSVLIALDGTPSSLYAARFALGLAKEYQAHVEGLGIVNSAWIQRPEATPIGGTAYKSALKLHEMQSATERVAAVMQDFRQAAQQSGVASFEARETDGSPADVLEVRGDAFDLIALGRESMFDVDGETSNPPLVVERIIARASRPILLLPAGATETAPRTQTPVLVAFDGSQASSRALHLFALLGLARDRVVHVVTLDEDSVENAEETAARAAQLLQRHGPSEVQTIALGDREAGTPAETVLGVAKTLGADMIVMGSYGHRGIRDFFGSCTRQVLRTCPTALFVHH